jgi:hypothetical protein
MGESIELDHVRLFDNTVEILDRYTQKKETLDKSTVSIDKEISQLNEKMEIAKSTAKEALE